MIRNLFLGLFLFFIAGIVQAQTLSFTPDLISGGCESATYQFITTTSGETMTNGVWTLEQNTGNVIINQGEANFEQPQISYVQAGIYEINFTADVGGNPFNLTDFVTVYSNPEIFITVEYGTSNGNPPYLIDFNGKVTADPYLGEVDIWEWSFDNGETYHGQNITREFQELSPNIPRAVQLRVLTEAGCHDVVAQLYYITNIPEPIPDFIFDPAIGFDTPHEVQFTDKSYMANLPGVPDREITQWFWDFGDGNTSNVQHPTHIYNSYNDFPVTLSVGSEDNIFASVTKIYPMHLNQADFTFDCGNQNLRVSFNDTSVPHSGVTITKREWTFGDATSTITRTGSSNTSILHQYSTEGLYNVTIKTFFSDGDTDTKTQEVRVLDSRFSVAGMSCKAPSDITLTAFQTVNVDNYQWTINSNSITEFQVTTADPTHTFTIHDYENYSIQLDLLSSHISCPVINYAQNIPPSPTISIEQNKCSPYEYEVSAKMTPDFGDEVLEYEWFITGAEEISFVTSAEYTEPIILTKLVDYQIFVTARTVNGCEGFAQSTIQQPQKNPGIYPSCLGFDINTGTYKINISAETIIDADRLDWEFISVGETVPYATFENEDKLELSPDYRGETVIQVTASKNFCPEKEVLRDTVYLDGVDAIISSDFTTCAPFMTVEITNHSFSGHEPEFDLYYIDFGDGQFTTVNEFTSIQHGYNTGKYTVNVTLRNTKSECQDTDEIEIIIKETTNEFAIPDLVCMNTPIDFNGFHSVTSGLGTSHLWTVERLMEDGSFQYYYFKNPPHPLVDGNSRSSSSFYHFTTAGNFRVTYHVACSEFVQFTTVIGVQANFSGAPSSMCENVNFTLTDDSKTLNTDYPIVSWRWDFDDGTTETHADNRSVNHEYTSAGTYNIFLTVTNTEGCSSTKITEVVVTRPNANFNLNSIFCVNDNVIIRNVSSGADLSYFWDFDDGSTSTAYEPTHQYSAGDFYTVSLTVTDASGCKHTLEKNIQVYDFPDPDFTVTSHPIGIGGYAEVSCVTEGVTLAKVTDEDYIVSYLWEYGDGFISNQKNPAPHFYAEPGRYSPTLTLYNEAGCKSEVTKLGFISIAGPIGGFTYAPEHLCYPDDEFFTAGSMAFQTALSHYEKIEWDFGDGIVETQDFSHLGENQGPAFSTIAHNYAKPGVFYPIMTLIDNLECRTPYATKIDPIKSSGRPFAQFSSNYTELLCQATFLELTDESYPDPATDKHPNRSTLKPDVASWYWEFIDTQDGNIFATSHEQNPKYAFEKAGKYEIRLTVSSQFELENNLDCNSSTSQFITVISPEIFASYTIDDNEVCPNESVQFRDNGSFAEVDDVPVNPDQLEYTWNFGDGTILVGFGDDISITEPTHEYTEGGFYTVSLSVKDYIGCTATDTKESAVHIYKTITDFTPENPTDYRPVTFSLSDISTTTDAEIVNWEWQFIGGNPIDSLALITATNYTSNVYNNRNPNDLTYNNKGEFLIFLTVTTSAGCVETTFKTVRILNNPPEITDLSVNTDEDTRHRFTSVPFVNNYYDKDGDLISETQAVFISVLPKNGTLFVNGKALTKPTFLSLNELNNLYYLPDPHYFGVDEFWWQAIDSDGDLSNSALVKLNVSPINDTPTARSFTMEADSLNEIIFFRNEFRSNYADVEGDPMTHIQINCLPENGTLYLRGIKVNENQVIKTSDTRYLAFIPDENWTGKTTLCWSATDGGYFSRTALVEIIIPATQPKKPINYAPRAQRDIFEGTENTTFGGNVLSNDDDIFGSKMTVNTTPIQFPKNGTVELNENGNLIYTPNTGYFGTDSVIIEICNVLDYCQQSLVYLTVTPINDAPNAVTDKYITLQNGSVSANLLANDSDPENNNLRINTTPIEDVTLGELIINSDGTFIYTPNLDATGVDSFVYEVCDDQNPPLCSQATVFITITKPDDLPITQADNFTAEADKVLEGNILENDFDPNGGTLSASILTSPEHGNLILNTDGTFIFTPDSGFVGTIQFTYQVCNELDFCTTQFVDLVYTAPTEKNDDNIILTINSDEACVELGGSVSGNVLNNDEVSEGTIRVDKITQNPENGTLTIQENGDFLFIPNSDFIGNEIALFQVCSGENCENSQLSFCLREVGFTVSDTTLTASNNGTNATIILDSFKTWVVSFSGKTDGGGTVSIDSIGNVTYESGACFFGRDSISYQVCDSQMCLSAMIYFDVPEVKHEAPIISETFDYQINTSNFYQNQLPDSILNRTDISIQPTDSITAQNIGFQMNSDGSFILQTENDFAELDSVYYQICATGIYANCTPCSWAKLRFQFEQPEIIIPIPNGVSPNGDGKNDIWIIPLHPENPEHPNRKTVSVIIYNRWGNVVYEDYDYNNNWEGQCNQGIRINDKLPVGTYFYIVEYEDLEPIGGFLELRR